MPRLNYQRYAIAFVVSLFLLLILNACTTEVVGGSGNKTNMAQASSLNVQLGNNYLRQGNRSRAKQKFLLAVQQAATPQSYGALAYFYEQTSELNNAESYYKKAISEDAKAGAAHNNYGAFLCRQKRYPEAESEFMLAVQDKNYLNDAGAYENAGLCALLIPNNDKAVTYFKNSIAQNPNMSVSILELAKLTAGQNQLAQAFNYMQQYIKTQNATAAGLLYGAKLAKQAGRPSSVQEFGFMLKTNFAGSAEYQQYLRMK